MLCKVTPTAPPPQKKPHMNTKNVTRHLKWRQKLRFFLILALPVDKRGTDTRFILIFSNCLSVVLLFLCVTEKTGGQLVIWMLFFMALLKQSKLTSQVSLRCNHANFEQTFKRDEM